MTDDQVRAARLSDLFYNWGGHDIESSYSVEDFAADFLDFHDEARQLASLLHWTAADLANDYKNRP